jgi:hypothetical protein
MVESLRKRVPYHAEASPVTRTFFALIVWLAAVAYALQANTATGFFLYLAGWAVLLSAPYRGRQL